MRIRQIWRSTSHALRSTSSCLVFSASAPWTSSSARRRSSFLLHQLGSLRHFEIQGDRVFALHRPALHGAALGGGAFQECPPWCPFENEHSTGMRLAMIRAGSSGSTSRQGVAKRSLLRQRRTYFELLSFTVVPTGGRPCTAPDRSGWRPRSVPLGHPSICGPCGGLSRWLPRP